MAQLVEHWLPKPRVAGSSPVYRSLDGFTFSVEPSFFCYEKSCFCKNTFNFREMVPNFYHI